MKKRSEEIAEEIEENEKQYKKLVEGGRKKIIELNEREYNNNNNNKVSSLSNDIDNTKKQIIQEAGKFLETYLMAHFKDKICLELKRSFKGLIKPSWIEVCSQPEWRQTKHSGLNGKSKNSPRAAYRKTVNQQLTEYEQKYVKIHEQKVYHNENVENLIDYYLGMTEQEKTAIYSKAKRMGKEYHSTLIEEAYDNMLRIVKSLNDADIPALLADIRFLKQIMTKVADMALNEHEQRKQKMDMIGQ
jgi:hypothetical protein